MAIRIMTEYGVFLLRISSALQLQRLTLHWSHGVRKHSSCCSMAQARFWVGVREQSFAGSSRPRGIFPIRGSDFSSS